MRKTGGVRKRKEKGKKDESVEKPDRRQRRKINGKNWDTERHNIYRPLYITKFHH